MVLDDVKELFFYGWMVHNYFQAGGMAPAERRKQTMVNDIGVECVCVGERKNVIAEYAAFDPTEIGIALKACRYLVKPVGQHEYDTDWFPSRKAAMAEAKALATQLGVKVASV